ncbi:hypothetical protein Pfo_002069 [Paulownia fortunei]|nr:hypothetical protein Pfo_002069 [Paulownia fortunei]
MGGLGKTTLVKKVYDDASVKLHFDHYVWITMSESFKVEQLLENMIKQLVGGVKQPPPQGLEAMSTDEMKEFIYKFLEHKSYLIIIDDVWKIYAWEAIRYAFPRSTARGCIIITTRFNSIGNAACTDGNGRVHNLEPLPAEESKKLFYKKAFQGNPCPHYLKEISENILKRCEGLPLAIVVIGGLLATKNNRTEEWEMFNRSLGHELEGDNLKRITKLLSLSYYDLPYYLKSCFLYMSMFREDSLLDKWRLIRLWIAEGFVHAKEGKTLEEVAEGYLTELLNRSLIQVAQTSLDGRPKSFRIHDLLRQYIISKSREQSIVTIASGGNIRSPNKIRRLAIHSSINDTLETYSFEHLTSLFLSESVDSEMEPVIYKILCGGCRLLKVLKLIGAPLETIPDEVFKLYHLSYLSLRRTKVKLIPRKIKDLVNLETLDLKHTKVTELPIEILKLHKLRNLLLYSYKGSYPHIPYDTIQSFYAPYKIGRLCSLQKLCYIEADQVAGSYKIVTEIGKLTQLRRLGITKLRKEDGKDLCSSLEKLTNLRSLYIFSIEETEVMDLQYSLFPSSLPFLRKIELHGSLEKVPPWISSLDGLTVLFLGWSRLKEDPLESLQDLPNLSVLWIDCAYEGEGLKFKKGGFQRLKEVGLQKLSGLKWVRVEKGSMPRLEEMFILNCKSMAEVPAGVEHLTSLRRVEFSDMSEEFVERFALQKKSRGEEWKLAHVPRVGVFSPST